MLFSRTLAIALGAALPLAALPAQSDSSSATKPPKWELSLGADPTDFSTAGQLRAHFVSTLSRNWQNAGSRFSRHLSLMVGSDAPYNTRQSCYGCWSNKQYAALTAGVAADLFHVGRFTPYLHTGTGLYYTHVGAHATTLGGDAVVFSPARNEFSLGINGGLGLKARIFSHEFFIDQTLHAFDVRRIDHGVYPLSIGIRW
jgi:hypothetical protein